MVRRGVFVEGLDTMDFRDWLGQKKTRARGLSRLDYERRFIGPERLCVMKTRRMPNPMHERTMWKHDLCTRRPENHPRD